MENVIEIKDLDFEYVKHEKVFSRLDLVLPFCNNYVICGNRECGKSSLVRLLTGLDKKYKGDIKVLGAKPSQFESSRVFEHICFIPEEPVLLENKTVVDNINYQRQMLGQTKLGLAEIESCVKEIGVTEKTKVKTLTKIQKLKLEILRASQKNIKLLFIDRRYDYYGSEERVEAKELLQKFMSKIKNVVVVANNIFDMDFYNANNFKCVYIDMGKAKMYNNANEFVDQNNTLQTRSLYQKNIIKRIIKIDKNNDEYYLNVTGFSCKKELDNFINDNIKKRKNRKDKNEKHIQNGKNGENNAKNNNFIKFSFLLKNIDKSTLLKLEEFDFENNFFVFVCEKKKENEREDECVKSSFLSFDFSVFDSLTGEFIF